MYFFASPTFCFFAGLPASHLSASLPTAAEEWFPLEDNLGHASLVS
jgi:hypothetical protein